MKTTIVTAFFDINRGEYSTIPRSVEQYFNYFERWARIKNNLIFFCENKCFADRVVEIRTKLGLGDKTITKIIDIKSVAPNLLKQMQLIESDEAYLRFRKNPTLPENRAMYDYVMLMKFYCTKLASEIDESAEQFAWIDFGFEHGGVKFENQEDYSFEWNYDFGEKITAFYIPPIDIRPLFEICKEMEPVCVMGAPYIVHKKYAGVLWDKMLENERIFAQMGLIDDDQIFLLMLSRQNPDIVNLLPSDWFMPIKDYGGDHFRVKPPVKESNWKKLVYRIKVLIKKVLHVKRK